MSEPFPAAQLCDTCGRRGLEPWLLRADGLHVLQCPDCGTGVVERLPGDLDEIYSGDYYDSADEATGYGDYAFTAEHSVGWAAAVLDVLRPDGGAALDIGCADGALLTKLGPAFARRAGIEMNPGMADRVRDSGLELLAHDVYDPVLASVKDTFDVVSAVAVFEHVPQFQRAVRIALDTAKPDGLLLFEVPVMSEVHSNEAWLTSSLEHLYYPTTRSLKELFRQVLQVDLQGGELHIQGYGATFVGFASRDPAVAARAGRTWERLTRTSVPGDLSAAERRARAHLQLVHAARTGAEELALVDALPLEDVNAAVLRRFRELWLADAARRDDAEAAVQELRTYLSEVETARDHAQQDSRDTQAELREQKDREALLVEQVAASARTAEEALAAAADWERQAHLTHAQLLEVTASSMWRATAPLRSAVTSARLAARQAAVLRTQANPRRVKTVVRLLRQGDMRTIRQRLTAVHGTAAAAAGLSVSLERGPRVEVVRQAWPQDKPLVSLVIVCYNYGRFLEEALGSALAQTFSSLEIVVVDGGSDDPDTLDVLDRLERKHPQVRFLRRTGRHLVGDNRNFGIAASSGKYVCCLDADDVIDPIYLEMATYLLEAHDYDVVSTATRTFGLREETFGLLPRPALEDMLLGNNVCTVAVFSRALWEQSGGYHDTGTGLDHIHEDWKLWVRLAALGARMINITGQELFAYRVHSEHSLSNLAGTPDMQLQREAVTSYSSDLLDAAAFERSERVRDEVRVVADPLRNLARPRTPDHRPTVLLAMPFLIVGGAERLLSEVGRHLASQDFRLVIVTTLPTESSFGDTSDWFHDATREIYHLPRLLDVGRWEGFLDYLVSVKEVDVVLVAGSSFVYSLLPALRAKHPQLRVADLLFNTIGHTASNRAHARDIDVTLVENREVERWLVAHGEAPERIRLVESGVDLDAYRPSASRPARDVLRFGFSGRLSEEKDPLGFLDIAAQMRGRSDVEFVMTGGGPLDAKVRQRLASRGAPQNVTYLGLVDDVRAHLADLDLLVLPSRLDGRPVVVLEALALGTPVVASAVGALPDLVVDGETGALCAAGDVQDFVRRLSRFADDREALGRARTQARRFAEEHLDARVMFARYEEVLRSLAASPATSSSVP